MPASIDENEKYDKETGAEIHIVQNKDAVSYRIHGIDAEPFEIETIADGSCGNNYKTCAKLWLKSGRTLDREEKDAYHITGEFWRWVRLVIHLLKRFS